MLTVCSLTAARSSAIAYTITGDGDVVYPNQCKSLMSSDAYFGQFTKSHEIFPMTQTVATDYCMEGVTIAATNWLLTSLPTTMPEVE
jgi:hypothetical protein